MRNIQDDAMMDLCQIGTRALTEDGNSQLGAPSYGTAVVCGVGTGVAPMETNDGTERTVTVLALRLPIATEVNASDYVQVIERHGAAISPFGTYQVQGIPTRGPTGLVAKIQRVQGAI